MPQCIYDGTLSTASVEVQETQVSFTSWMQISDSKFSVSTSEPMQSWIWASLENNWKVNHTRLQQYKRENEKVKTSKL